ncbi:unnamed protein product [Blumeria hordei]|uniref:ER membrane protein complex subunit 7 beta-sandwich domain-containing protein n=2 Tax=Blumeria hordei TaxID=2867405 RepID=A0A383UYQ4_BLUHO|nr:hypothetical protein BGHDH14_bgh02870 [Blumeria hordei DH14]SZF04879.1 unnamed protein product [Blumeria hordei]
MLLRYLLTTGIHVVSAIYLRPHLPPVLAPIAITLPPSTHATLTTLSQSYSAPLRTDGDFEFHNVSPGSYLMEIYCHSHFFMPLRVDVLEEEEEVQVWTTFRGSDWENKGEAMAVTAEKRASDHGYSFPVKMLTKKEYLVERPGFSPLNLLKNPMLLMAGVTMAIVFGMPYLMDNIDPDIKAEFEESQKKSALNPATANPLQNFDAASWLAGSSGVAAKEPKLIKGTKGTIK